MSALSNTLRALFSFLEKHGQYPPTQDVRVVEIGRPVTMDELGRPRIRRDELREVTNYEARFEELLTRGFPWINVSCYGVYDHKLIVGIELPEVSPEPAIRTSVNYSGPPASVVGQAWNSNAALLIE
jgi:hypothetical protein